MTGSHPLALFLAGLDKTALSALPDAPVVNEPEKRSGILLAFRGRLATALHRAAWIVEPKERSF